GAEREGDGNLGRDLSQLGRETGSEWDAVAAALLLALPLGLARHVDAVLPLGLRRFLQLLEKVVHVGFEGGEIAESRDVDLAEEVPDVGWGRIRFASPPHVCDPRPGQDAS